MIRVRKAQKEDDEEVGELLIESFTKAYARKMPELRLSETRKNDLRDVASKRKTASVLVAVDESDRIVGTVTLYPPDSSESFSWKPDACDLRAMAIFPLLHGKDLGGILLDAAIREAERLGAHHITLHVRRGAAGVARFYERHGWKRDPDGDQDCLPEIFKEGYTREIP